MRGKQGAAAARRREAEALSAAERLKREKAQDKARYQEEVAALRLELATLRNEVNARAAALAHEEIERVLAEKEEARRAQGLSDELVEAMAAKKDDLVRQACRYLSMREGILPVEALRMVITWMSGEPYLYQYTEDYLVEQHGLPRGGWAVSLFRENRHAEAAMRRRSAAEAVIPLDEVEERAPDLLHEKYQRAWWRVAPTDKGGSAP